MTTIATPMLSIYPFLLINNLATIVLKGDDTEWRKWNNV